MAWVYHKKIPIYPRGTIGLGSPCNPVGLAFQDFLEEGQIRTVAVHGSLPCKGGRSAVTCWWLVGNYRGI